MKKNVTTIVVAQVLFAIQLMVVKYAITGFRNVEMRLLLTDIVVMVPTTVFIIALTILVYTGIWTLIQDFKIATKKKPDKQKGNKES